MSEDDQRALLSELEAIAGENDARSWLCSYLPRHFRGDEDQFAAHQKDFWNWAWPIETGIKPKPSAYLVIWNRGGNKSTSVEAFCVAAGARGKRKYALVVSRTQPQADAHVYSINRMILSSRVGEFNPYMAQPKIEQVGNKRVQAAWNREKLTCGNGFTIQSFGVESSIRGVRVEEYRPDLIIITDIDDVHDSSGYVDTLLEHLSGSILGTASNDCAIVFDQNLIHRDSVLNRILTRKTDVLSDRVQGGPIPAVLNPSYERRQEHWFITSGEPTWVGMPLAECEAKVNDWGKERWEREAQHNVNLAYPDAVYPMWDEAFHVITWSEFAQGFIRAGCPRQWFYDSTSNPMLPTRGKIVQAQDWGNNSKHPCANRWTWTPAEEMRLTGYVFNYREMCWPRFPLVENDSRAHPSALQVGEAILDVERPWNEGNRVQWRLASHERPEIVQAYRLDMPKAGLKALSFAQIDTRQAREGILHMQNFLRIEPDKKHPFRFYPDGHPKAGQPLDGCPKLFFIVADGQGELYWDAQTGKMMVMPAINEAGQARTRDEYPNYRKPDTAEGAERKDAPKLRDDVIDCDRAIAGVLFPSVEKLTFEMKVEREMPAHSKPENIAQITDPTIRSAEETARYMNQIEIRNRLQRQQQANSGLSLYEKAKLYR